jgi:hypothetical protein
MEFHINEVFQYKIVRYESTKAAQIKSLFKNGLVNGVSLYPYGGFKDENLDCLLELENLHAVCIQNLPNLSLNLLVELPKLEYLTIDQTTIESTKFTIDFSKFTNLKSLATTWHKKLFIKPELSNLEKLYLWKYKSATNDLTDFPQFNQLQTLDLTQGTTTSLNGISRFAKLNDLALHYLSKLEYLGELELPELKKFRAENCKKLVDHEQLGACSNLEIIRMLSAGNMKSVAFVNQLKQLKSFNFLDTEVLDGDLNPLLRLDSVFFTEKKHYSHKTKNFNQMMDGVNVHKPEQA